MKPLLMSALVWTGLLLSGGQAWADFAAGLQAYDGGDYRSALENWQPLANAGDADAQVALAGMYLAGVGVPRDFKVAARWYKAAADQGHVQAQLNLGELYAIGKGLPRDPVQAMKWLGLAAATGHSWAVAASKDLAPSLSRKELEEARHLIDSWKPNR